MKRRASVLLIAGVLAVGLISAAVTRRQVERKVTSEIVAGFRIAGAHVIVPLRREQTARVPIEADMRQYALRRGALAPFLARQTQFLPVVSPPAAWTSVHATVVGPFLLAVDVDAGSHVGSGALTQISRTLDVALFGSSWTVSAWGTGAVYSGITRPANSR